MGNTQNADNCAEISFSVKLPSKLLERLMRWLLLGGGASYLAAHVL